MGQERNRWERRQAESGSISIFVSLVTVLVLALVFTMLESARVYGLQARAKMNACSSTENVFAEYNQTLWREYQLLFVDGAYGENSFAASKIESVISGANQFNLGTSEDKKMKYGSDFFKMEVERVTLTEYALATDAGGGVMRAQAIARMKDEIPMEILEKVYEEIQSAQDNSQDVEVNLDTAYDALEQAEETETENDMPEGVTEIAEREESPLETGEWDNPLDVIKNVDKNGILTLVVDDPSNLSEDSMDRSDCLEFRSCEVGDGTVSEESWVDKLLFYEYLLEHNGHYGAEKEGHALQYEMEYLVGGKTTDRDNLKTVVNKILAIREACNFVYLLKDPEKRELALSMATSLVGFTGIAPLVMAVEAGILAAWALIESIQDVKSLLAGDKIPLIKSSEQWSTDTKKSSVTLEKKEKAKKCEIGLDYEMYLRILLFTMNQEKINDRSMDLMEHTMQVQEENTNLKMDHMVQRIEGTITYQATPLFLSLVTIGKINQNAFNFQQNISYSY